MEQLILRQAAIDALVAETIYTEEELKEYYEANSHRNEWVNGIYESIETVKQLPPIQPEPHWIPVTERLPQAGKSVMICDVYGDICIGHRTQCQCGYYYPDFCEDKIKDVRAWCELPEPYKGVTT